MKMKLGHAGVEADGLEVRKEWFEGSVFPEDFFRIAPQVDVILLGPRLDAVGLCRLQRLVDYDRKDDAREGVTLAASSAALAEVLEFGLGLGGAHVDRVVLTGDRVVSENKRVQRGVGCGQGLGRSLGRRAFVGVVGVL